MTRLIELDISNPDPFIIDQAAFFIDQGSIITFPTDTLYGLVADAWNEDALKILTQIKKRKTLKPLPCLAADSQMAFRLAAEITECALKLSRYWPAPLTLVMKAAVNVPPTLEAGSRTIGVRVPDNLACRMLCRALNRAVVATSANIEGEDPLSTGHECAEIFEDRIIAAFEAGPLPNSLPSTIVSCINEKPEVIREGAFDFAKACSGPDVNM